MLLLEKENTVGGLARSIYHEGFIMDFCAHRFHSGNQKLLDEVLIRWVRNEKTYKEK